MASVGRSTCFPFDEAEVMGETMGVGPSSCRLSDEVIRALVELRELLVLLAGAMADLSEVPTDDFASEGDGEGEPGLTALRCWSILVWRVALPLANGVFAELESPLCAPAGDEAWVGVRERGGGVAEDER